MHVKLFCDTDIIGGCRGTRKPWGRRGYSFGHMILGFLETMGFNGSLIFEIWVDIQGLIVLYLVVTKVGY